MRSGPWHQFGHNSQKIALEQLSNDCGEGVVLSARDLALDNAAEYAQSYRELGAAVVIDQQFYVPSFNNKQLKSYPTNEFRNSISTLHRLSDDQLASMARALQSVNETIATDAIIAPAVVYEAGRPEVADLNSTLFSIAKGVGESIGVPTYATVVLGRSAMATDATMETIVGAATSLTADGWYFGAEFDAERIPCDRDTVLRFCKAGLRLATTGRPVLHAYAGPMGLLSRAFGVTGVGIGHAHNLWTFKRDRWEGAASRGGGGDAPPRFFSNTLWGTIIHPDETARLGSNLRGQVLTHSPYSQPVASGLPVRWKRWDAGKHLIHCIGHQVKQLSGRKPRQAAKDAIIQLENAVKLHQEIKKAGIDLRDGTNEYQQSWSIVVAQLLDDCEEDYEFFDLL